jgi:multisubunit Na+/H+ antiporter MnhB subunit
MGERIAQFFVGLQGLVILATIVIVIFLIFRRLKIKKSENFEKRDN